MHFATTAATVVLAFTGLGSALPNPHTYRNTTGLQSAFSAAGKQYIGTALTIRNDTTEQNIIRNPAEFGSITPENAMKWESTEPSRGDFTFGGADEVVEFATKNGKEIRCHTLIWYSQLPTWVSGGGFDNATLIEVMKTHINEVMGRYKGKCTHWDVVNEALNEDGTYRDNVFYRTIGESYLPLSFHLASLADPSAKLYYNDYNLEYGTEKAAGAIRIVKLVQSYGVRIDGVGLQAHLTAEKTPTNDIVTPELNTLVSTLKGFTDLGVDVAYTELDIRVNTPVSDAAVQAQYAAYERVFESCLNVERCVGITLWGVSDKYSWIPGVFAGEGSALLWDENLQKKPAYSASLKTILHA